MTTNDDAEWHLIISVRTTDLINEWRERERRATDRRRTVGGNDPVAARLDAVDEAYRTVIADRLAEHARDTKPVDLDGYSHVQEAKKASKAIDDLVQSVAEQRQAADRYRKALPTGWFVTMEPGSEESRRHGFPDHAVDLQEYRARDGSLWIFRQDVWEIAERPPENVALLMQDRQEWQTEAENSAAEVLRLKAENEELRAERGRLVGLRPST